MASLNAANDDLLGEASLCPTNRVPRLLATIRVFFFLPDRYTRIPAARYHLQRGRFAFVRSTSVGASPAVWQSKRRRASSRNWHVEDRTNGNRSMENWHLKVVDQSGLSGIEIRRERIRMAELMSRWYQQRYFRTRKSSVDENWKYC